MRRILFLPLLVATFRLATPAAPLFTDVTTTNLPQDANLHSLDIEFGDFDKDGDLDMVIASENTYNRIYLNDGKGKFTETKNALTQINADNEDVQVEDFDKDGNLDIIVVAEETEVHQYYQGDGKGSFKDVSSRIPSAGMANAVEAGDVNKDGYSDVFIGNGPGKLGNGQDLLLINDHKGGFLNETSKRLPTLVEYTQDLKLGDLDGDGDLDLVIGNETPKNRLLINDGNGFFSDSAKNLPITYIEETREVLLFDVDNDKDLDIVFCNLTCNACDHFDKNPQVRLLINDGKAHFTDETGARLPKNTFSSWDGGYLDMDADGDLDLILCTIDVPGFVAGPFRAYRNDGKGFFTDVTSEVMPASAVGRGWDVEVADVNGDGALDMGLGGWGTQARLLLGTVKQPVFLRMNMVERKATESLIRFPSRPGTVVFLQPWEDKAEGQEMRDLRGHIVAPLIAAPFRP